MSVLDSLIKIKTSTQDDDLLKLLDEISIYEKLSVDEKLKDLKTSKITRTKCPILAAFSDGKLYETILADLAANVYLQIEGHIPAVLETDTEKTLKQQKQMEILQSGIIHVEYRDLMEYDHEIMKYQLAAVFTNTCQDVVTAAIIVREPGGYKMYHGTYVITEINKSVGYVCTPLIIKGHNGIFTMDSYSILGNNGYRFGHYVTDHASYDVMIGPDDILYLLQGDFTIPCKIPKTEKNRLNMSKNDPQTFAETVTLIIESVITA